MSPQQRAGDQPVFTVMNLATGGEMKVWADGGIEGFPPGYTTINNGIRTLVNMKCAKAVDAALTAMRKPITTVYHRSIRNVLRRVQVLLTDAHVTDIFWLAQELEKIANEADHVEGLYQPPVDAASPPAVIRAEMLGKPVTA